MVIFQIPNKELLITISGFAIAMLTSGLLHALSLVIGYVAGIIWSYREISEGVNSFRKILGTLVLLYLMFSLLMKLS